MWHLCSVLRISPYLDSSLFSFSIGLTWRVVDIRLAWWYNCVCVRRHLEGPSLVAAAGVSRRWLARCRADPELRRRVRSQLFREGRGAFFALQEAVRPIVRPARPSQHAPAPLPSCIRHAHANTHAFARVNAHVRQLHTAGRWPCSRVHRGTLVWVSRAADILS